METLGGGPIADLLRDQVLRLSYTAVDFGPMDRDLDHEGDPMAWAVDDRSHPLARLDALLFRLHGITRPDAGYILDQFPIAQREDEQAHRRYPTRDFILAYMNAIVAGDLKIRLSPRGVVCPPPTRHSVPPSVRMLPILLAGGPCR